MIDGKDRAIFILFFCLVVLSISVIGVTITDTLAKDKDVSKKDYDILLRSNFSDYSLIKIQKEDIIIIEIIGKDSTVPIGSKRINPNKIVCKERDKCNTELKKESEIEKEILDFEDEYLNKRISLQLLKEDMDSKEKKEELKTITNVRITKK